jgi:hypothetical protein
MASGELKEQCGDNTQELKLKIPCKLAERIDACAMEDGSTITMIVIEALDAFLRERNKR